MSLCNLVAGIFLAKIMGAVGIGIATAFSVILFQLIIINFYYHFKLKLNVNRFFKETCRGLLLTKLLSSSKFIGCSDIFTAYRLPGGNSEFIFTYIVSGFGWLWGIMLILILSLFIIRMFSTASKISDRFGKYLCIGICCAFPLQVITNILMNLGFFPITGISLPFISYGGGNFVCNMALIGLLLGVYRRKDIILKENTPTVSQ
jgi:cell division protein FtsW (lipid II flippase)